MNTTELSFQRAAPLPQILQLTWRCERFCDYQLSFEFIHYTFTRLKALKIEVATRCFEDSYEVAPRLKISKDSFYSLRCLSVMAERGIGGRLVKVPWSGVSFPEKLKSLRLEGVHFLMPARAESDVEIFGGFLVIQPKLKALHLDVDSAWWKKWGRRFEDGILHWIRARPHIERMKCDS